ncbi:carbohydrate-binding protein [Tengunoibacter tsumagoiensis]|uniref:CBM6 domain-containing protein n=1 Tax=Tengunoibacter tsumagoiensis TaxID=2014871 RepID=A0A401ZV30_9CHLR|nr:carbohydrate-binding protein [Tengunoibacter tsumagoiensis]GCE10590.1 hypothetical protein KTT_04490 [Tengunoibacter tsumagoiensis]
MLHRRNADHPRSTDGKTIARSNYLRKVLVNVGATILSIGMLMMALFWLMPTRSSHAETTPVSKPYVGVNMGLQFDMFTDMMKDSGTWTNTTDNNNAAIDANGWPTQDAQLYIWQGATQMDGTYKLSFNGKATLSNGLSYAQFNNQQYNASTNTTTVDMVVTDTGFENFQLTFKNTQRTATSATNTGVTNVQVFRPTSEGSTTAFASSTIFTPWIESAVAPYSYMRFMSGTNWNSSVNWSDRTTVNYATQQKVLPGESGFEGNQMAFEYMVKLANETNLDLYVNVPDRANDDYITKLAQLVLYGSDGTTPYTSPQSNPVWAPLNANLHLYVEYTNEAWNFQFQQAHDIDSYADQEACGVSSFNACPSPIPTTSPINYDGASNEDIFRFRYYAQQSEHVSSLFRSVFGDSAMGSRVRPLLFWQYDNLNNTAQTEIQFLNDYYNNADGVQHVSNPHPLSYYFWGGGGAVYYHSNNDNASTVDGIFNAGIPSDDYQKTLTIESYWAHAYGLHDAAYEGGWAIGGDGATTLQNQAKNDPRAKQTMLNSYNDFVQAGGDLYTVGTYGQWDHAITASSSPLVQAAAAINASTYTVPAVTLGFEVAGSTIIPAAQYTVTENYAGNNRTNLGVTTSYQLRIDTTGSYQIAVGIGNATSGGKVGVYVDGALLSTITVPNTGSTTSYQSIVAGSSSLTAGVHSVQLRATANASGSSYAGYVNALFVQPGTGTPPSVPTPGALPSGWLSQDIGGVGLSGAASYASSTGTYTLTASGGDIWNSADQFRFAYQQLTGDGSIVARVTSLSNSNPYAKIGVMMRDSLNASAANVMSYYSPSGDTTYESRTTDNGTTNHPTPIQRTPPYWVKLVRAGNTFTGYNSPDGQNWTQQGSDTITMPSTIYLGLAVDAHDNTILTTGTIDNVTLTGSISGSNPTPTPTPTPNPTPTPTPIPTQTPTPTPTPPPASWMQCASEGGTCTFSGTQVVRYGANGHYNYQTATGSIGCNNTVFGDPIVGTFKSCSVAPIPPSTWTQCASEWGTCTVPGTVTVAYGSGSTYVYKTITGSVGCNNNVFGDPTVGVAKTCYYK